MSDDTAPQGCDSCGSVIDTDGTVIEGPGCEDCVGEPWIDEHDGAETARERIRETAEAREHDRYDASRLGRWHT